MKTFGRLVVLVMLFTSIVAFSQKEALAVPLKPILDHVVEPLLIDSTQAASSQDQEQEDEDDIEQTDSAQ